jgi:hypothetical protein
LLSSFANSYGGILIVGVSAPASVPLAPFEGIVFPEREPGLTVQNICRDDIFPEIPLYTSFVSSRIQGKAFLVAQVNESPKAPHAIEHSTQVYIRTGDSSNPTALADMGMIERLLLRRREVLGRWEDFYAESFFLAERAGLTLNVPRLELRVGPLYPTEVLITREKVSEFLGDSVLQHSFGFEDRALRHPQGAILSRNDHTAMYLNIGELGTIHYLEPLLSMSQPIPGEGPVVYPFWWITHPVLRIIDVASALMNRHGVSCNLRVEARLENVPRVPFTLSWNKNPPTTLPVSTLSATVPASASYSSDRLGERIEDVTVELLYQLRWPFGKDKPHTREQIQPFVAQEHPNARVRYSNALGR